MKIYIGADHRGFKLKEELKIWLAENKIAGEDAGALKLNHEDDYMDYAKLVNEKVLEDIKEGLESRGIVICGSGIGMDITANKTKGIRCGLGFSEKQIEAARREDDINVLALSADYVSEKEAKEITRIFLETKFLDEEKYQRRLRKILEIEEENFK